MTPDLKEKLKRRVKSADDGTWYGSICSADELRELLTTLDATEKKFDDLVRGEFLTELTHAREVVEAAGQFMSQWDGEEQDMTPKRRANSSTSSGA